MFVKDYVQFIFSLLYTERGRVKRIFFIIILGSFLSFFIVFFSASLKLKIQNQFQNQYVILPYIKGTPHVLEPLDFPLILESDKKAIKTLFDDLIFIERNQAQEILLHNLSLNQNLTMTYEINSYDDHNYINESFLTIYDWQLKDLYTFHSELIHFDGTHLQDVDLILSKDLIPKSQIHRYTNFLTLESRHNIQDILEVINTSFVKNNFEYQVEPFNANTLYTSLVGMIEKILLGFSFLIFIVSTSNIGTIMPYFMNEFKDEITLLRELGLPKNIIHHIFALTCFTILVVSLLLSSSLAFLLSSSIVLVIKAPLNISLIKWFLLLCIQTVLGLITSLKSIKKASDSITYL